MMMTLLLLLLLLMMMMSQGCLHAEPENQTKANAKE